MKKIRNAFIFLSIIICFTACKKNYTCECTMPGGVTKFTVPIEKVRKNDAKTICDDYGKTVYSCVIK